MALILNEDLKLAGRPGPLPQYCPLLPPGKLSRGEPCCAESGPPGHQASSLREIRPGFLCQRKERIVKLVMDLGEIHNGLHLSRPSLNHGKTA